MIPSNLSEKLENFLVVCFKFEHSSRRLSALSSDMRRRAQNRTAKELEEQYKTLAKLQLLNLQTQGDFQVQLSSLSLDEMCEAIREMERMGLHDAHDHAKFIYNSQTKRTKKQFSP